jgi:hypothetical protein
MRFHHIDRAVPHDGRHPSHRRAERIEGIGSAPDARKTVVQNFFSQFPSTRDALRNTEQQRRTAPVQARERIDVTRSRRKQQPPDFLFVQQIAPR